VDYARSLLPDGEEWHGRLDSWAALQGLTTALEALVLPEPPDDSVWYGWEPLPLLDFIEGITMCRDALGPGEHRFLDVGCGIGDKLVLARALGFEVHGIERHAPYAAVARDTFDVSAEVEWADAYERYDEHDVVYCNRLARDESRQTTLGDLIADRMRPGSLFWCVGPPYPERLTHVGGVVWRK
jgi:SAM-dependent methyltransferase